MTILNLVSIYLLHVYIFIYTILNITMIQSAAYSDVQRSWSFRQHGRCKSLVA